MKQKEILDGYTGIKFDAFCESETVPHEVSLIFDDFKENTNKLKKYNMTPKNGGNVSCRVLDGFAISASGANLGLIEEKEIIYVSKCSVEEKKVTYSGSILPSSETLMHYLIYSEHKDAQAVIHAHDEIATGSETIGGDLKETVREEPYGTVELARLALDAFSEGVNIILLKNHGYVSTGSSLSQATDVIINMHEKLMKNF